MDKNQFQKMISSASMIGVVGDKSLKDRNIGKNIKLLLQTGVMSAVMAVQAFAGANANDAISPYDQVSSLSTQSEIQNQSKSGEKLNDVLFINPVELSSEAREYIQENGAIDSEKLLISWADNGVSPTSAIHLTSILVSTQSPIFVSTQLEKDRAIDLANRTKEIFTIKSQEQADAFIQNHAPDKLEAEGLVPSSEALSNKLDVGQDASALMVMQYWRNFSILSDGEGALDSTIDPQDLNISDSIENVRNSVRNSGLSSLKVPIQMWTSSSNINEVAIKIDAVNEFLQKATGWQGPVLGLNGRNSYHLGSGTTTAAASISHMREGATVMSGRVNAAGHEWFHTFDYLVSYDLGFHHTMDNKLIYDVGEISYIDFSDDTYNQNNLNDIDYEYYQDLQDNFTTSQAIGNFMKSLAGTQNNASKTVEQMSLENKELFNAWGMMQVQINEHSYNNENSYYSFLDERRLEGVFSREDAKYFNREEEKMAYSFDAYAISKSDIMDSVIGGNGNVPFLTPSQKEASSSQSIWESSFKELEERWWRNQLQRDLSQDIENSTVSSNDNNLDNNTKDPYANFQIPSIKASNIIAQRMKDNKDRVSNQNKFRV